MTAAVAQPKAKKKSEEPKRRGYSRRARSEHPGVTVSNESRPDGSTVVVLRWYQPGTKRHCKETVRDASGLPVSSREKAKPYAVAKSRELTGEKARIIAGKRATDTGATWELLKKQHVKHLEAKGRTRKTIADYQQSWPFLDGWPMRPSHPHKLTLPDLQDFVHHVRKQRNKYTGARLAPATVEAVVRHVKAALNYGRKFLSCVKLDLEAVNAGLDTGTRDKREPVALSTSELNSILEAAVRIDRQSESSKAVCPLLAAFMLSGCRRGELERLRWNPSAPGAAESSVDFEGDRLLVWSTKTHRHRHVPFRTRPELRRLLEVLAADANREEEPYVFGGRLSLAISDKREEHEAEEEPKDALKGRSLKLPLLRVRRESGVAFALKSLRSTLATYLANSALGANLYQVAFELGHDYQVLTKHYAKHRELPAAQANAATVAELLGIAGVLERWLVEREAALAPVHKLRSRASG